MTKEDESTPQVKPIGKGRVRNTLGGKNPQLAVKGKKLTKPSKGFAQKDKNSKLSESITPATTKPCAPGKGNIPSSSNQASHDVNKQAEKAAIMAYMKSLYHTHGENLLNKFKNADPIRNSLCQIVDSDKIRAEGLGKMTILGNILKTSGSISPSRGKTNDNGDVASMKASERVISQHQNLC